MALELNGTTGVSLVQDGVVTAADLASGAITSAALPAGSVLQVVSAINNARFQTTSTSFVAANLQASITPTSASSKILVLVSSHMNNNNNSGDRIFYTLFRDGSVNLATDANASASDFGYAVGRANIRVEVPMSMCYLDSPNTTSSTTYKTYVKSDNSRSTVEIPGGTTQIETMTLMEIAG